VQLWDPASGAETARLKGYHSVVPALCALADGRLASASRGTVRLWDPATGTETARFEVDEDESDFFGFGTTALCELVDGRLASGSHDGTVRLWDTATGAETTRLEGHRSCVTALCALADGRLASGSHDGTVRLWDTAIGAETTRLDLDEPIFCLSALAGTRFVAGGLFGRLHWLEVVE
jgi:WD40 repeat protein